MAQNVPELAHAQALSSYVSFKVFVYGLSFLNRTNQSYLNYQIFIEML